MRKLNTTGMMGLFLCFVAIIFGIVTNGGIGTISNFIHIPSFIVTFGGAFFAVLATADSFEDFKDGLAGIYYAYKKPTISLDYVSGEIIKMADIARKEGLLSLESYMETLQDPFLTKGIRLVIDGSDPELLKDIMESELIHKEEQQKKRIQFWQDFGAYAPAWGMVGTLLGLINMMKSMGDNASGIGAGMSLALITTLYGSVIANWICIPVARKLDKSSRQEQLMMEIIIEGVLSIQAGENTRFIKEKISAAIVENTMEEEELQRAS